MLARVHAHQVVEPALGGRLDAVVGRVLLTAGDAVRAQQLRALLDRRRLEEHGDRVVDPEGLLDLGEEANGDEGVPAEVEEAVVDADLIHTQELFPELPERPLQVVARRDVVAVQLRARGSALLIGALLLRPIELGEEAWERYRGDRALRRHRVGEEAAERFHAFRGEDALADVVRQQLLRSRSADGPALRGLGDRGLRSCGEHLVRPEPLHLEALHIYDHLTLVSADLDVDAADVASRVDEPHVRGDAHALCRQAAEDAHVAVCQRDPESGSLVGRDELHGEPCRQVEQRRVHPELVCFV